MSFRGGAAYLLGEKGVWENASTSGTCLLNSAAPELETLWDAGEGACAPRSENPREKRRYRTMYTGSMIDELIGSVERAERHAREVESLELKFSDFTVAGQTDSLRSVGV